MEGRGTRRETARSEARGRVKGPIRWLTAHTPTVAGAGQGHNSHHLLPPRAQLGSWDLEPELGLELTHSSMGRGHPNAKSNACPKPHFLYS